MSTRHEKELVANAARRRLAGDVSDLARSGDALVRRGRAVAKVATPLLIAVAIGGGLLLLARRALRPAYAVPSRPSFTMELLRRATLSFASVAAARWARSTPLLGPVPAIPNPSLHRHSASTGEGTPP